jgi:hypothetical protein
MSIETIRSLFRVLENTLHERLTVIEDVINNQAQPSESNNGNVEQRVARLENNNSNLELHQRLASLESIFGRLHDDVKSIRWDQIALNRRLDILHANMQLESAGSDERPVEAVEAEVELETAEAEALDADIDASEVERGATVALKDAVKALPLPVSVSAKEAEDEEAEEEEAEEAEEEAEDEEAEEEAEEAEEEAQADVSVEEFIYRNKTYYRDSDNKVYRADEEGDILDEVIGVWNPTTKKIQRTS